MNPIETDEQRSARLKSQVHVVTEALANALHVPSLAIGIDLDGCIDEAPDFFRNLSQVWPGEVYVITYRNDLEKARRDVESFGIRCTEVVMVNSFAQKADEITRRGICVYFDDQDEILMHVPENVSVFKIRNGGNYDFDDRKWLYSEQTGRAV
jgi:hypothetical protein